jgi:hypothetical protein
MGGRSLLASNDTGIGLMCLAPNHCSSGETLGVRSETVGPFCRAALHLVKQWGRAYRPHVPNASANPDF